MKNPDDMISLPMSSLHSSSHVSFLLPLNCHDREAGKQLRDGRSHHKILDRAGFFLVVPVSYSCPLHFVQRLTLRTRKDRLYLFLSLTFLILLSVV